MPSKLWDISQILRPSLPVWPGDTAFNASDTWSIGPDCPVNVSKVTMSTHSGSHADAPRHYDDDGLTIEQVDLVPYIGPCHVIDVTSGAGPVMPVEVMEQLPAKLSRVILRTYSKFPHGLWEHDFRPVDASLINQLAARGVILIGVDAPSLDPETSKTLNAHMAVKTHSMAILEGLVLDKIAEGQYELIAMPLKIEGADAAPVRAVLREL